MLSASFSLTVSFFITSPSFGTTSVTSPSVPVSPPPSQQFLAIFPLHVFQELPELIKQSKCMRMRVYACRDAPRLCISCTCACISGCVTGYKCLSCPFLCAHSPKHPLLHLQSGPHATFLTAEAGREGQLKHHTHTHSHACTHYAYCTHVHKLWYKRMGGGDH